MTSAVRPWVSACVLACVVTAAGPLERAAAGQSGRPGPGGQVAGARPDEIVVTGCLAAANIDGYFMLTGATLTAEAKATANMPPNRSATETEAVRNRPRRYRLSGSDLNALVGQRVEVTGSIGENPASAAGRGVGTSGTNPTPPAGTDRAANAGTPPADDDTQTLNVRMVKPVSGTCT